VRIDDAGRPAAPPVRLSTGLDAHTISLSSAGNRLAYSAYHARVNIWTIPIPASGPVGLAGAIPLTSGNQGIEGIAVSRDARWLYFTSDRTGNSDIYRLPLPAGEPEQLTSDPADDFGPAPSPDGAWLAFYSLRKGSRDLWLMPTGPGEAVPLTDDPGEEFWPRWSPDGQSLCYGQLNADSGNGTRLIRRSGTGWSKPVFIAGTAASSAVFGCSGWMPDGKRLIIQQGAEIALVPVDGGLRRVIYRADLRRGFPMPTIGAWASPDGHTIYFRAAGEGLWCVSAEGGTPRELVRFDDPGRQSTRQEWATDGRRFYFSLGDPQSDIFIAELAGLK
jgi:Tol biopolymer transport system component